MSEQKNSFEKGLEAKEVTSDIKSFYNIYIWKADRWQIYIESTTYHEKIMVIVHCYSSQISQYQIPNCKPQ